MSAVCDQAAGAMGSGVSAALTAVDCIASAMSEQAFGRLFGSEGQLAFALTIVLGLYVAFFGISLMLGRSSLSVRALVPKMMTLGLVLTFATSFVAFSSVFYNIFVGGPDQVAGILTGAGRGESATGVFAQKLDVVFVAVQQASGDARDIGAFSPPGMMWLGAMLLLLGTVGEAEGLLQKTVRGKGAFAQGERFPERLPGIGGRILRVAFVEKSDHGGN